MRVRSALVARLQPVVVGRVGLKLFELRRHRAFVPGDFALFALRRGFPKRFAAAPHELARRAFSRLCFQRTDLPVQRRARRGFLARRFGRDVRDDEIRAKGIHHTRFVVGFAVIADEHVMGHRIHGDALHGQERASGRTFKAAEKHAFEVELVDDRAAFGDVDVAVVFAATGSHSSQVVCRRGVPHSCR